MASILLLGAGASFGSEKVGAPPLGANLFDALESRGGIAASLPIWLKSAFKEDFEQGMLKYYEHSDRNIMTFQRELARFLAEFQPTPDSVYIHLIKQLGIKRVIYCSLNYDLLFEQAASMSGYSIAYDSIASPNQIRLLKLHGSSNFWPLILGTLQNVTFRGSGRADIDAQIRVLNRIETLSACNSEDSSAPAMAMYAPGKAVKISPSFVEQQQNLWCECLGKARRVLIVGTRLHMPDHHLWGPIGRSSAWVGYFGLPADRPAFDEWKGKSSKRNAFFLVIPNDSGPSLGWSEDETMS